MENELRVEHLEYEIISTGNVENPCAGGLGCGMGAAG